MAPTAPRRSLSRCPGPEHPRACPDRDRALPRPVRADGAVDPPPTGVALLALPAPDSALLQAAIVEPQHLDGRARHDRVQQEVHERSGAVCGAAVLRDSAGAELLGLAAEGLEKSYA